MMNWVAGSGGDFAINIFAAVFLSCMTFLAGWFLRRFKELRLRRFWKVMTHRRTSIVLGAYDNEYLTSWEPSGLVGFGDVRGGLNVQAQFARLGLSADVANPNGLPEEAQRENLILVGGPDANRLTRAVLNRIDPHLSFVFPGAHANVIVLADKVARTFYIPRQGADGMPTEDYGVIIKTLNPFGQASEDPSYVLVLAGCWGYGTTGAAMALADKAFLQHSVVKSGDSFEALVEMYVDRGVPYGIKLVEARLLSEYTTEKQAWSLPAALETFIASNKKDVDPE